MKRMSVASVDGRTGWLFVSLQSIRERQQRCASLERLFFPLEEINFEGVTSSFVWSEEGSSRYAMNRFSRHIPLFRQAWRTFGSLDTSPSSVMRNAEVQTIHSETLNISKKGRLEVRCPFNLYVTPLNHKDFPRLDKAFFTIYGRCWWCFSIQHERLPVF